MILLLRNMQIVVGVFWKVLWINLSVLCNINCVVLQGYVTVGLGGCIHFELSSDFV